jgi:hypothetical protein
VLSSWQQGKETIIGRIEYLAEKEIRVFLKGENFGPQKEKWEHFPSANFVDGYRFLLNYPAI